MSGFFQDLAFGLRSLLRRPGLALAAVLTLAFGIGGASTIFGALYTVVLSPLPFPQAERLVLVGESRDGSANSLSGPEFERLRDHAGSFEEIAAFYFENLNLTGDGPPEKVQSALVTPNLLKTLGVEPLIGRPFRAEEGSPGQGQVALISEGLWQRRFGGEKTILGQQIHLDGSPFEVVGVLPASVQIAVQPAQIWTPLVFEGDLLTTPGTHILTAIGRLRGPTSLLQASAEATALLEILLQELDDEQHHHGSLATSLHQAKVGPVKPQLLLLMAAVVAVLLIACTNIANLLLVRSEHRRREMALRMALGAGRSRLVRQMLTESLAIALLGGFLGFLMALWATDLLDAFSPAGMPALRGASLVARVPLIFSLGLSLLTGLVIGGLPALHASRIDQQGSLTAETRGSTAGRSLSRGALVVTQVALSLVLLIGAGLLLRSFWGLLSTGPGFDSARAYTLRLHLSKAVYPDPEDGVAFSQDLLAQLEELPWVAAAGVVNPLPLSGNLISLGVTLEASDDPQQAHHSVPWKSVSPGYFSALGVPLVRGRLLNAWDNRAGAPPVVVINETMARHHWPGKDPLGKRITIGYNDIVCEVVGVVKDIRHAGLGQATGDEMHTAVAVTPWGGMDLVLRTTPDSGLSVASMSEQLRQIIWKMDAQQPVDPLRPIQELIAASVASQRYVTGLVGAFALVALAMAALGIYGVLSFSVARRTREIGIRMALGARPGRLLRLVLGQGMAMTGIGIALGLAASWALSRLLASQLYEINASDPLTYAVVAITVGGVAMVANYLPARRAAAVDPIVALRQD